MKKEYGSRTALVTVIGSVILAVILIGGSVWMVRSAQEHDRGGALREPAVPG
jgi:heme/copper-type cytochrome/quinol oxidase subunit 4